MNRLVQTCGIDTDRLVQTCNIDTDRLITASFKSSFRMDNKHRQVDYSKF